MNLSFQLNNDSLFQVAHRSAVRAKRLREKLVQRLTSGQAFVVWEIPYGEPDAVKAFLTAIQESFPPPMMQQTLFFVNHSTHQSFLAVGFPPDVFAHLQPALNQIVGVIRNFNLPAELLVAMAIQGVHHMESSLTPAKIDRAYAGRPAQAS